MTWIVDIITGAGYDFEAVITLLVVLSSLVFYVKDVRFGSIMTLFFLSVQFIIFESLDLKVYYTVPALITFFIINILLLYSSIGRNNQSWGGYV